MPRCVGDDKTFYRVTETRHYAVFMYGPYSTMSAAKAMITREKKKDIRRNNFGTYTIQVLTGEWVECDE